MRLKQYTAEDVKENQGDIVQLTLNYAKGHYSVAKPEIVKVTEKQFKTKHDTVNFSSMGSNTYGYRIFILNRDLSEVLEEFKRQRRALAEKYLERANEELHMLENFHCSEEDKK